MDRDITRASARATLFDIEDSISTLRKAAERAGMTVYEMTDAYGVYPIHSLLLAKATILKVMTES